MFPKAKFALACRSAIWEGGDVEFFVVERCVCVRERERDRHTDI